MFDKLINSIIIKSIISKGRRDLKRMDRNAKNAFNVNEKLLLNLLKKNQDTEYGKKYDFKSIKSIDEFRERVPFSDYDTYAPYIERMVNNGEKKLITAFPVIHYAMTSGSIGAPKYIPITKQSLKAYDDYTITRMMALADEWHVKNNHHHIKPAKGLNTLEITDKYMKDGTPCGNISGTASKMYDKLFKYFMTSPQPVLYPKGMMDMKYCKLRYALQEKEMIYFFSTFMTHVSDILSYLQNNWELLCDDIEKGTINEKVKIDEAGREALLAVTIPDPERANELRKEFEKGFDETILKRIWPNLSLIGAIGTGGFSSYTKKVQKLCKDIPIDYSVYASSESLMASARHIATPEFNLLPDSCFYEFLPVEDEECTKTLLLNELEVGKEYEIIITTFSGFYRYRILDVIRVLGYQNECPIITFAYRRNQMINIGGEKTTEEQVNAAIETFSKEIGVSIPDYSVYADDEVSPGRYVFILEPDSDDELDVNCCDDYAHMINSILCEKSYEYEESFECQDISMCQVLIQQKQTHQLWRELRYLKGATPNQIKPVRLLDTPMKKNFFRKLIEE